MTTLPLDVVLLGVDWGSTRVRGVLLDADAGVLDARQLDEGVRTTRGVACGNVFAQLTRGWRTAAPDLPSLLTGMVGSAQGWTEAPYVSCPARLDDIAQALVPAEAHEAWIVPGVSGTAVSGAPDVMRGEETQLMGLSGDGLVVLPGTHSKWAEVREGAIVRFTTCLTGEAFELLRVHGLIGAVMEGAAHDEDAFQRGIRDAAGPGGLLHQLFTVRSRTLLADLAPRAAYSYASGLLIGAEVGAMTQASRLAGPVRVVGAPGISARYQTALRALGHEARHVDGGTAASRGLLRIARAAGLVPRLSSP